MRNNIHERISVVICLIFYKVQVEISCNWLLKGLCYEIWPNTNVTDWSANNSIN